MALTGIVPCAEGYVMWSYRCANCDGAFNMVETRTADSAGSFERRVVPRHSVAISATVEFGGDMLLGMVRNVSAAGARLELSSRRRMPGAFILIADGSRLLCRLIWRKGKLLGIAFR